jgi:hypothetical protein
MVLHLDLRLNAQSDLLPGITQFRQGPDFSDSTSNFVFFKAVAAQRLSCYRKLCLFFH